MDQKLENILNLALGAPEEEREQTGKSECRLQCGEPQLGADRKISWQSGRTAGTEYCGGRADCRICDPYGTGGTGRYRIGVPGDRVCGEAQAVLLSRTTVPDGASCFPPVTRRTPFLNGRGVLFGCIGFGITWDLEVFRKADGSTGYGIYGIRQSSWDRKRPRDQDSAGTLPQNQVMWDMENAGWICLWD